MNAWYKCGDLHAPRSKWLTIQKLSNVITKDVILEMTVLPVVAAMFSILLILVKLFSSI